MSLNLFIIVLATGSSRDRLCVDFIVLEKGTPVWMVSRERETETERDHRSREEDPGQTA